MTVRHDGCRRGLAAVAAMAAVAAPAAVATPAAVAAGPPAGGAVLTGKVRSDDAQAIFTPPSMSMPVVLRFYVPDGTQVKKGDTLLRIDAGRAAAQLRALKDKIEQTQLKTDKEVADLELKLVDAKLAVVDAEAARDKAALDAALPRSVLPGLDYDRYQGLYKTAQRQAELKGRALAAAGAAVKRRRDDGALAVKKLRLKLQFLQTQVETATVTARRAGVVIHLFKSFGGGGRFEQGSTSFPGMKVGEVVRSGRHSVRAWALEPDRRGLKVGQAVRLSFDALPGARAGGHIRAISGAAEEKPEWGTGRYYTVDIALDAAAKALPLLPGMSVRVETGAPTTPAPAAAAATRTGPVTCTGEIRAEESAAVMPPVVKGLWQLNVTRMAADGAKVKKGQVVVVFAGGDLARRLPAERSELAEKKRAQKTLRLELADRKRDARLATAKAKAELDKARREAKQPKGSVPGNTYKKLLIDRRKAKRRFELMKQREKVAAADRAAQQRLADAEAAQLAHEVANLEASLASLMVRAPRAGLFLHHSNWRGDKIDTGSQVWRGQSVAEIPDMASLAVRASLPERDIRRVRLGQAVQVTLTGSASRTLSGKVVGIGHSVHSKSRVEPVPVVDLRIHLDHAGGVALKPEQPVEVEIPPAGAAR